LVCTVPVYQPFVPGQLFCCVLRGFTGKKRHKNFKDCGPMAVGSYVDCLEQYIIMCFVIKILKHVICACNIKGFSSYLTVNTFRFGYAFEPITIAYFYVLCQETVIHRLYCTTSDWANRPSVLWESYEIIICTVCANCGFILVLNQILCRKVQLSLKGWVRFVQYAMNI
jgi:hypothetical protein